jgi:hypothetical protein
MVLYVLRQLIVDYRKTLSWNVPEEIDSNNETYAIYLPLNLADTFKLVHRNSVNICYEDYGIVCSASLQRSINCYYVGVVSTSVPYFLQIT